MILIRIIFPYVIYARMDVLRHLLSFIRLYICALIVHYLKRPLKHLKHNNIDVAEREALAENRIFCVISRL